MRYAILSDIHANLEALTAVLADIERQGEVDGGHSQGRPQVRAHYRGPTRRRHRP